MHIEWICNIQIFPKFESLDILDTNCNLFTVYMFTPFNTGEYCEYSYVISRSKFFITPPNNDIITAIDLNHQLLLKSLACCQLVKKFASFRKYITTFSRIQYMHYYQISNGIEIYRFSYCYFIILNYLSPIMWITFVKKMDVMELMF
jgi:hypothetical protein